MLTGESWSGGVSGTVTHSYDDNFFRTSLKVNSEPAIAFDYDDDGLLTNAGALILTRDAANGGLATASLNFSTDFWDFSLFGELEFYSAEVDGSAVYNVGFIRDKLGRITEKTESIAGGPAIISKYTYDPAGRLWQVKDATDTVMSEYLYDANGNRVEGSVTTYAGTVLDADYDDQDRLTNYQTTVGGVVSFIYSANGEIETKEFGGETTRYTYDALGILRRVVLHEGEPNEKLIEYLIDGRNRRIGRKVDGTLTQQWVYQDQLKPVAEIDQFGNITQFVYASKNNAPDFMIKGGITYRFLTDHLGSVRLVVDVSTSGLSLAQRIVQRLDYDEFGNVDTGTVIGADFQNFGFAGGFYDPETELVHFGARDYNALTGRWIRKDPIRFDGKDANLYGYVLDDPINLTDASGLLFGNLSELYDTAWAFRTQYGHDEFPGEARSDIRHCVVSCMVGNQFSPGDARAAGFGNELQGLVIDVSNAQSRAFEISDLIANEAGIASIPQECFLDERDLFVECINRCLNLQR